MNERWTWVTSPWPWQVEQVTGLEPSAAPEPLQRGQSTAVSTRSGLVVPNAASASSRSSRTRASWPRRTRDRGPRAVCWPNIASTRLVKSKPPPPPAAEAAVEAAAHAAAERVAAAVVEVALLGVLQHLVRLGDLLEPVGRVGLLGHVGVQLHRQLAIGLLDLLRATHRAARRGSRSSQCSSSVLRSSSFGEEPADVAGYGADRRHGRGVVHPGRTDARRAWRTCRAGCRSRWRPPRSTAAPCTGSPGRCAR